MVLIDLKTFKKGNEAVCSMSVAMLSGLTQNKYWISEQFFIFLFLVALSLWNLSTLNIYVVADWLDNENFACPLLSHPAV